ncbi:MAG TPA: lasso peptide biosynthesis B2 protein [Solirubrobacteraceae bacterium]
MRARSAGTYLLGIEAGAALLLASVALRVRRRRNAERLLGTITADPAAPPTPEDAEARRVGRAVARVARVLPHEPSCLRQAIATRWMLRRRGIACEAHLGIVSTDPFEAHAWVTVGGVVVLGGPVVGATELAVLR